VEVFHPLFDGAILVYIVGVVCYMCVAFCEFVGMSFSLGFHIPWICLQD